MSIRNVFAQEAVTEMGDERMARGGPHMRHVMYAS
jgi:hypothetical protein